MNLGIVLQECGDVDGAIESYRSAYRLRASTFGIIATALTSAPLRPAVDRLECLETATRRLSARV